MNPKNAEMQKKGHNMKQKKDKPPCDLLKAKPLKNFTYSVKYGCNIKKNNS